MKETLINVIYVLGAVATFGWTASEQETRCANPAPETQCVWPEVKGLASGLTWPIYWPLRLSWDASNDLRGVDAK